MKKRVCCLLLALCLCAALLPGAAFAVDMGYTTENGEATLTSAGDIHISGEVTVPDTLGGCPVTAIGAHAFDSCTQMTGIVLPETVRTIGASAFRACTGLEYIYLPAALESIADGAFTGCGSDLIIFGERGSYAESFAAAQGYLFLPGDMPFTDVPESAWYYWHVYSVYAAQLMVGTTRTTFGPNEPMNRAMLATVLYRMAGSPDVTGLECGFTDVNLSRYYGDAVLWCVSQGIVKGVTDTRFAPEENVTREQTVAMLSRWCAAIYGCDVSGGASLDGFADAADVHSYARAPFAWAISAGIIAGMKTTPATLEPRGAATRAQVAKMLVTTVQYLSDEGYTV